MTTIMNSSALVNEEESPESTDTMEGVEESESDEEWENIDEAVSFSYQTLCLFCTEVFNSAELMFAHCETGHIFDAFNFFKKMNVNAISYIQFINFIRKHKLSPSAVMHISTACPWSTDFYMKPFDLNDPLLVFDIEGYMEEKENERTDGKDSVTIPNSEFQTLMQELTSQTERLKNAYDRIDRMKLSMEKKLESFVNNMLLFPNNISKN